MQAAVIENGKVTNVIEAVDLHVFDTLPNKPVLVPAVDGASKRASIGDTWNGLNFTTAGAASVKDGNAAIDAQVASLALDTATLQAMTKAILTGDKTDLSAIDAKISGLKSQKK